MDKEHKIDDELVKKLFENGVNIPLILFIYFKLLVKPK